jgi:cytochrome c oxidase cbb3-type subunit 1
MTANMLLFFLFQINTFVVDSTPGSGNVELALVFVIAIALSLLITFWILRSYFTLKEYADKKEFLLEQWLNDHTNSLDGVQLKKLISIEENKNTEKAKSKYGSRDKTTFLILLGVFFCTSLHAQPGKVDNHLLNSPGMLIIAVLILIPLVTTLLFAAVRISRITKRIRDKQASSDAFRISSYLKEQNNRSLREKLVDRKKALDFRLGNSELAGELSPSDNKGILVNISEVNAVRFISPRKKAAKRHDIDPAMINLILWFLATATFWLLLGTTVGEYLGIKFVAPDADHVSWLSFGRLRPVHTNIVFWGWSSQAMIGLGYYVVSTVSNSPIASIKIGYQTLVLLNAAVLAGSILLMAGINNGGGEYREYIWPVMLLFAAGIALTLFNFIKTIAKRKTAEIYISNWYIIAALMFILVIVLVAYIPFWQNGLGETIVQGFYMHQAVGMWFMMFNLGLIYYFLPQQLNTPIYSYSLGIIAFWSQILFYTVIGTHHFLFSAIPWWLQVVAIIGSVGMLIPVFSGTTNFLMTFRGNFQRIGNSYTLPFYLVGIIFYFTGSTQGTAEAFRSTNLIWHFTDFTVAHSHMTMYGIIAFMLWACIYTLVPRLTGKEPKQSLVGAHFWLALVGILFYSISLMIGGTLKGISWVEAKPFIEGVKLMAPYWLWRAIGGSLMWVSHLVFAWNMYTMIAGRPETKHSKLVMEKLVALQVKTVIQ